VTVPRRPAAFRALTRELDDVHSPVRRFLQERYTYGLREVQRQFRAAGPSLVVPSVPRDAANPRTVGTAADWLLRFLLHPAPDVSLAMAGAAEVGGRPLMRPVAGLAAALGATCRYRGGVAGSLAGYEEAAGAGLVTPGHGRQGRDVSFTFTGPAAGSTAEPGLLARGCWALALLTELFRAGRVALIIGPLGRLDLAREVTTADLLALAPEAGRAQLAGFRRVFETALLPRLTGRAGPWALGPVFSGSELIGGADADLIAAGLLLDLKTPAKLSLGVTDMLQLIGYVLLDFDDQYQLAEVGLFSARYAHLTTWELRPLLTRLAGRDVDLAAERDEFRDLLRRFASAR
jgi:hypothetical protein